MSMVKDAAAGLGVDTLDLTDAFTSDWNQNHQPFSFPTDYHWNTRGHLIVGQAMSGWVTQSVCAKK